MGRLHATPHVPRGSGSQAASPDLPSLLCTEPQHCLWEQGQLWLKLPRDTLLAGTHWWPQRAADSPYLAPPEFMTRLTPEATSTCTQRAGVRALPAGPWDTPRTHSASPCPWPQ